MADLFQAFAEFFVDIVLLVPRLIFWGALEAAEVAAEFLAGSSFVDPTTFQSGFTSDLVFFMTVFEVPAGLGFIVSALVARFILRRIPMIG